MWDININILDINERHFPGQTLRRKVHKWDEVAILEKMSYTRHGWKQNTVAEWLQVKQGENQEREQGADVEVDQVVV